MKQTRRTFNWLVACALALVMVSSAGAAGAKERTAKVVRLTGAARYSTGNNVWQPVKIGTILKTGALIQTAAGSFVDVVLSEGEAAATRAVVAKPATGSGYAPKASQDVIRIREDTVLAFEKLSATDLGGEQVTETQLDLRSGKIFGTVKKLSPTSRYEIKLPNGVAGIRGTIYSISADGVVQVVVGSVVISWVTADGTTRTETVNAGYQFDARTGLVTPIPTDVFSELQREARALLPGPGTPAQILNVDNTIYYVSPTTADNGSTGGGDNQTE